MTSPHRRAGAPVASPDRLARVGAPRPGRTVPRRRRAGRGGARPPLAVLRGLVLGHPNDRDAVRGELRRLDTARAGPGRAAAAPQPSMPRRLARAPGGWRRRYRAGLVRRVGGEREHRPLRLHGIGLPTSHHALDRPRRRHHGLPHRLPRCRSRRGRSYTGIRTKASSTSERYLNRPPKSDPGPELERPSREPRSAYDATAGLRIREVGQSPPPGRRRPQHGATVRSLRPPRRRAGPRSTRRGGGRSVASPGRAPPRAPGRHDYAASRPRVALERSTAVALRPTVIGGSSWTARAATSRSRRAASPGRAKVKRARSMHQHPRRTDVRVRRKSKTLVIHALVPVPGCAVAVCTRRRVIRPNQPAVGIASSKTG